MPREVAKPPVSAISRSTMKNIPASRSRKRPRWRSGARGWRSSCRARSRRPRNGRATRSSARTTHHCFYPPRSCASKRPRDAINAAFGRSIPASARALVGRSESRSSLTRPRRNPCPRGKPRVADVEGDGAEARARGARERGSAQESEELEVDRAQRAGLGSRPTHRTRRRALSLRSRSRASYEGRNSPR